MANIKNLEKLVEKLRQRAAAASKDKDPSVVVGYTAAYALYVHENEEAKNEGKPRPSGLGVYWGPSLHGPKFLEAPARELGPELGEIAREALRQGKTLAQALLLAGLRLQRESMQRVPVEYGNLRASAFTRIEKGEK